MKAHLWEHPKLKWQGISTWPPQCGGAYGPGDKFPMPGEGNLDDVEIREEDYIGARRLSITIDYLGRKYSGQLPLDDPDAVTRLYEFLKKNADVPLPRLATKWLIFERPIRQIEQSTVSSSLVGRRSGRTCQDLT